MSACQCQRAISVPEETSTGFGAYRLKNKHVCTIREKFRTNNRNRPTEHGDKNATLVASSLVTIFRRKVA